MTSATPPMKNSVLFMSSNGNTRYVIAAITSPSADATIVIGQLLFALVFAMIVSFFLLIVADLILIILDQYVFM